MYFTNILADNIMQAFKNTPICNVAQHFPKYKTKICPTTIWGNEISTWAKSHSTWAAAPLAPPNWRHWLGQLELGKKSEESHVRTSQ